MPLPALCVSRLGLEGRKDCFRSKTEEKGKGNAAGRLRETLGREGEGTFPSATEGRRLVVAAVTRL